MHCANHSLPNEMSHRLNQFVNGETKDPQRFVLDAVRLVQIQACEHRLCQWIPVQPRHQTRIYRVHETDQFTILQRGQLDSVGLCTNETKPLNFPQFNLDPPFPNSPQLQCWMSALLPDFYCNVGRHPFWDPSSQSRTSPQGARTDFDGEPVHPVAILKTTTITSCEVCQTKILRKPYLWQHPKIPR